MSSDDSTVGRAWSGRPHTARRGKKVLVAAAAAVTIAFGLAGPASASTSTTSLTGGSLSIGTVTNETISVPVAGTGTGILPSASWSDSTGTGAGWNGTVALSDLVYTGSWLAKGSTALLLTTSGAFTDTQDGVEYTVTTGTITAGAGNYTWTSTDTTDSAGGSGTAVASIASAIGSKGITINFGTQSLSAGSVYEIQADTQSASAYSLDTVASGAGITAAVGTTSANPALVGTGTTVSGGGVAPTAYGTAIKFVSAALNTGMGSYTVNPGAQVVADASSWAATYTAGVQYSIVTGP